MALAVGLHDLESSCASTQGSIWPNHDRFVLSNGHASMLCGVLHLTGTQAVNGLELVGTHR
jgi:transketolase